MGTLDGLNDGQSAAVTFDLSGKVQILAGPGTGKTKTLTSRVAYMLSQGFKPEELMVMTFTKAASNEMKERVEKLVDGRYDMSKLQIGTFHSIMWRYLKECGPNLGVIDSKPSIIDKSDVEQLLRDILKDDHLFSNMKNESGKKTRNSQAKFASNEISRLKNQGYMPSSYKSTNDSKPILTQIWQEYENLKTKMHAADFDDILLLGRDLLQEHPECIAKVKCCLVDEFQDSNGPQLQIIKAISRVCNSLTVVGDPDQSIYGFRGAIPANMRDLLDIYPEMKLLYLEENYRSSQEILDHAQKLISQEEHRLGSDRQLVSSARGKRFVKPVLLECEDEMAEASYTASHIKKLLDTGVFEVDDMAILCRARKPLQIIEKQLRLLKIPCHVVGNVDFFERAEIKTMISYLRFMNNTNDYAAFVRIISAPKRGIGAKTLERMEDLIRQSEEMDILELLENWCEHPNLISMTKPAANELNKFIDLIKKYQDYLDENRSASDLGDAILNLEKDLNLCGYYSQQLTGDSKVKELNLKGRKENMKILGDIAKETPVDFNNEANEEEIETGIFEDMTMVQSFLYTNALDNQLQKRKEEGVTLTTVHGAKGLEWPVVFLSKCTDGTMWDDDEDQLRRLIFVAITRAKILSFVSYDTGVSFRGDANSCNHLMKDSADEFCTEAIEFFPELSFEELKQCAAFLGRPEPRKLEEEKEKKPNPLGEMPMPMSQNFGLSSSITSGFKPASQVKYSGFHSAKTKLNSITNVVDDNSGEKEGRPSKRRRSDQRGGRTQG